MLGEPLELFPVKVWADADAEIDLAAIKNLIAVHRLREVSCLYGFTRFEAAATEADGGIEDIQLTVRGARTHPQVFCALLGKVLPTQILGAGDPENRRFTITIGSAAPGLIEHARGGGDESYRSPRMICRTSPTEIKGNQVKSRHGKSRRRQKGRCPS